MPCVRVVIGIRIFNCNQVSVHILRARFSIVSALGAIPSFGDVICPIHQVSPSVIDAHSKCRHIVPRTFREEQVIDQISIGGESIRHIEHKVRPHIDALSGAVTTTSCIGNPECVAENARSTCI